MPTKPAKLFVLSVGGSLVNPGGIDTKFLAKFKFLLENLSGTDNKFILVIGGGRPARDYQDALKKLTNPTRDELDLIGICATRLNANLVRTFFGKSAYGAVLEDPGLKVPFNKKFIIGCGWKPGRSTDFVAVALAKTYGIRTVINLSNIDFVYTKDPNKFKSAEKIETTTWKQFRKIVGDTWNPGAHAPFDPIASKFAEQNKLKVIIANGNNLKNLENILESKNFAGTTIE